MAKTETFSSMKDAKVEEIEDAAEKFETAAERLTKARTSRKEASDTLVELLVKHKLKRYKGAEGLVVNIVEGDKSVTVKRVEDKAE